MVFFGKKKNASKNAETLDPSVQDRERFALIFSTLVVYKINNCTNL